ncbi:class I SAM-dependent methyltransferase [Gephyromycinifex aptenodytis]|uniref:class I SAM-dependent methyltransferase n=1 Tax=Gephyromycinifex aptenodytis TaxID=2716227 RepID=UPI00144592DE|nr:class I SAM-dependent methyltransferase [Gephyromycinifex aptenodytis]
MTRPVPSPPPEHHHQGAAPALDALPQEVVAVSTDALAAGFHEVDATSTVQANRQWWDIEAESYYQEHGEFLGDAELVWGPEGWTERELGLLGELQDTLSLEVGAGAAQGSRYVRSQGARAIASDISGGMLGKSRQIDADLGQPPLPLVLADGCALPFADETFDLVFSAYGAVPFVADSALLMRECARVLRPGGRFVFSTTHPIRWAFPDSPGPDGLTATMSYFNRTPYVETADGELVYAEHHRTLGDRVREIIAAGLRLVDLVEPEWPERTTSSWGGWSPLRGQSIPGTAIFVCTRE